MLKYICKMLMSVLLLTASALIADDYLFFSPQAITSHLKDYTEEEQAAIEQDLKVVRSICCKSPKKWNKKPVYLATAGSPGARKSTILERFLKNNPSFSEITYVDPDQRALRFMVHTYYSQSLSAFAIADFQNYLLATKAAYEKWRGASNYIALTLLEEAFAQRRDIAHGTTCTGEHIPSFLSKVQDAGYEIVLLLCSCEDAFRQRAIQYRNEEQKFYQSTPKDALAKGKLFPQRMLAYFTYADTLYLFWSDDLATPERCAAVFAEGNLEVVDDDAFNHFINKYEADRRQLQSEGKKILSWSELVDLYRARF